MKDVLFFRLLGAVEVIRDGRPVELGTPKQRAVLAMLVLNAGRVVSTDRLVQGVWGDNAPPSVQGGLQVYISNLRRLLRDDERATSPLVRQPPGYLADLAPDDIDVSRFGAECEAAEAAISRSDWPAAVAAAERARALWRGPLLVELRDEDWVRIAAAGLEERRDALDQNFVHGLLGMGRVAAALARSRLLRSEQPLSERACWLHMIALYRSGRPADALQTYTDYARHLDDELGLDPGPALRDLQGAILRQDQGLGSWPGSPSRSTTPAVVQPDRTQEGAQDAPQVRGIVGRVRELAVIDGVLREAVHDGPRWVMISGVAGIGKTTLAGEVVGRWETGGGRILRAGCPDDEGVPAWWPIRQVLRELGAEPDVMLAPTPGTDADAARFEIYERVLGQIREATRDEPVLLLVDDVHWADSTSLKFLTYLAEVQQLPGLAVLLTTREAPAGREFGRLRAGIARRSGSRQLTLPPLDPAEVAVLATRVSGQEFGPAEAAELAEHTGGNPFFVSEFARLPAEERLSGEIPEAVRSVLGRRLGNLDPAVLQVLRTAALIGDALDVDLLCQVTRLDREELADLLDEAADEHIIAAAPGTGSYAFAHALLRDEVIAGMSAPRRQRLHLRIAAAINPGTSDRLVRRAAQLVAALPLADAAEVFDACRAAALDAESRWESETAARWWGNALQAFDLMVPMDRAAGAVEMPDRDELVIAQVSALARAGRGQTVLDVLDAALVDAVRNDRVSSAGRLAATLLRSTGSWPWAVYGSDPGPLLARLAGLESLVRENAAAHVRILATLAVGSCYDPDGRVPDLLSQRALDVAEGLGDNDVLADALLGRALTFAGVASRAEESIRLLERLNTLPHRMARLDEVIRHGLLSMATFTLGDSDAAAEHVRQGAVGSDVLRLPVSRAQLRWAEGSLAQWHGDLDVANAVYEHAFEIHRQTELYESAVHDIAAMSLLWERGRVADGDGLGEQNPELSGWVSVLVAAAQQEPGADEALRAEIHRPEPEVWTTHGRLTLLAHAVADRGLRPLAEVLLSRLQPYARLVANIGHVGVIGTVGLAMARLCLVINDFDGARAHLAVARDLAERGRAAGELARCRELSEVIRVESDRVA